MAVTVNKTVEEKLQAFWLDLLYFTCVGVLSLCVYCTMSVTGAQEVQKKVTDPLELEFQVVRSRHEDTGN